MATNRREPPTVHEDGSETHPAWGLIGASRVQTTGATLFDSEIRHQHYVTVRISTARRKQDLNHDWLHQEREFVEVAMSEAQWASFVSSMNSGNGVACTITRREDEIQVPGFPYAPRMEESMAEVRQAANRTVAGIWDAFSAYDQHRTAANRRTLEYAIRNAAPNMEFAAKSLNEHAENVVQKARADIEAMVVAKAQQLGLNPADIEAPLELTAGAETP